jgi:hypothetical protein
LMSFHGAMPIGESSCFFSLFAARLPAGSCGGPNRWPCWL